MSALLYIALIKLSLNTGVELKVSSNLLMVESR
ncbi:MAG: hypothetical protein CM15mP16_10930 [Candidatus Pelagibacterales bacterium]|nr:MAG: hypothetical protein CM15mP16_10930 [Pelagibacterales bacterium]